jgi:hypothetical protein
MNNPPDYIMSSYSSAPILLAPLHKVTTYSHSTHLVKAELDEGFARQLLLEDEQQYAHDQIAL